MNGKEARIGNDSRSLPAHGRLLALAAESVIALCATTHSTYGSIEMEDLGLRALDRRVAGIDVHRMLHVVTVRIEQADGSMQRHRASSAASGATAVPWRRRWASTACNSSLRRGPPENPFADQTLGGRFLRGLS
jgi:hypothetical protein